MSFWRKPSLSTDNQQIIEDAIKFTKQTILNYYMIKYKDADIVTLKITDREREKILDEIKEAWEIFQTMPTIMDNDKRIFIFSKIGSILNLYLINIEKQIKKYDLPDLKKLREKITTMLKYGIYKDIDTHKYDEFYIEMSETTPNLIFISYSNKDNKIIGELSDILEKEYNYIVFRAHDKINIDADWREVIKINLNKCQALIAFVTNNFLSSYYAHQECGWILGQNKPVISLFLTSTKPGFLGDKQGLIIKDPVNVKEIAKKINEYLSEQYE